MASSVPSTRERWDAIVIGSGATGGWAALELGRHGLKVLVLEAGKDEFDAPPHRPDGLLRFKRSFDRVTRRRRTQARHSAFWEIDPQLFVVDSAHPYETAAGTEFQWIRTRSLNGRLLTWGGIGVRASDYELRAPQRDAEGPAWPFGYDDLKMHFDRIDAFWPVYGECDGLPQLPDGNFRGTLPLTPAERRFQTAAWEKLGRKVIASRGVLIRPHARLHGEPPPASPVREAMRRHGVSVRTSAVVDQVLVDDGGMATGVSFVDRVSKRSYELKAKTVVVCASTIESARILLNSRSRHHPHGVGNSSGLLGRNLMDHPAVYATGFVAGERDARWSDGYGGPKNILIPRFHNLENSTSGAFMGGYGAFGAIGRRQATKEECEANEVPFGIVSYGEMLPRIENGVRLSPDRKDAWGVPLVEIDCRFSANELAIQQHMFASLDEFIHAAGGRVQERGTLQIGGFVHEVGTARMGIDPKTSVLNPYAQSWDVPNVFVMDGAAWPGNPWQNPTFTMMAIAGRASEYLASELKQGKF